MGCVAVQIIRENPMEKETDNEARLLLFRISPNSLGLGCRLGTAPPVTVHVRDPIKGYITISFSLLSNC